MKNKLIYNIIITIGFTLLISGCSKDSFDDFVWGRQPNFIGDQQFVAGLNIMGIIRPDSIGTKSLNLFYVEKVIPIINNTNDSTTVIDYNVIVYNISNSVKVDSLCYFYKYPSFKTTHKPANFTPLPGNHFKIVCQSPGLPDLTAETVIPNQPVIVDDTVYTNGNEVQFSILDDSTAFLYDVYLIIGDEKVYQRVLRSKDGNTPIEITANILVATGTKLYIYAYDKNLSEYFTAANLFIKPNTYRPPFSTVQNGYGCFGSLNLLIKKL